jgi:UDP-glucose:(heptosyl)LPS alpha-1,3-glucosyltransferase
VEDDYWIRRFREWRYPFPLPAFLRLMAPKRFFDLRAERAGYYSPNLRLVLANSRMIAKTLVSYYPHVADRIEVVHNGADDIRFHPDNAKRWRSEIRHELQLDPEGLTAIFAAHDFKLKGLNHAVTALSLVAQRCPEQKLQMIVIGKSRSAAYVRLAGLHGIASAIRFCGSVSQPERYYAAADYLLYPTYYDPCANVVLEALASGLPVITTAQNGASELLTANHDGWIIEQPADTDKLAAHIAELRRPETLARMKSAARRTALQHTLEDKFRRITSLLCELNPVR